MDNLEPTRVNFGVALEALKEGKAAHRDGWNGKDMFAVYSLGALDLEADKFFTKKLQEFAKENGGSLPVRQCLLLKTAQNDVVYWTPSCSDILATDWVIV